MEKRNDLLFNVNADMFVETNAAKHLWTVYYSVLCNECLLKWIKINKIKKKKKFIGNCRNAASCATRLEGKWENYTAALPLFDTAVQKPGLVSPATKTENGGGGMGGSNDLL